MRAGAIYRGQEPVLTCVWRADRWHLRLRGLLFRPPLHADEGLLITPCDSVHTLWMGYALDILFLDRNSRAVGWRENLSPWRAAWCRRAHSTLEMRVGSLDRIAPALDQAFEWRTLPLPGLVAEETTA